MPMHGRSTTALAAFVLVSLVWLSGIASCSIRRPLDIEMAQPAEEWGVGGAARTAVDIRNYHGSVRILVDPRVTEAEVSAVAGAKPDIEKSADSRATESVTVVTDWVQQEGGRVLRVRTGATWPDPKEVWVDLTIRMPSCDGATIWNRGGWVELIGVEGAIQVDNGALGESDGTIRIRTAKAMTAPVTLTTDRGTVVYQVGANSTGTFDLLATKGKAAFLSPARAPTNVVYGDNHATAVLNNGTNPVVLRSGNGLVRVYVIENPEAYTNKWE